MPESMPKTSSVGGQRDVADHLGGLAEELEQVVAPAARRGHLIHHAARRADDEVLDLLRGERQLAIDRSSRRRSAASASNAATSSAADELTPLPIGTSDRTRTRAPCRSRCPYSRCSTTGAPAMYAAQAPPRIARQPGACLGVRERFVRDDVGERDGDAFVPRVAALDDQLGRVLRLHARRRSRPRAAAPAPAIPSSRRCRP